MSTGQPSKEPKNDFGVFTGCPRCAASLMLCSCRLIPKNGSGRFLALTPKQYQEWKDTGKVSTKAYHITIGIIGSRSRDTERDFRAILKGFRKIYHPGDHLVSGGCPKGGDRFAERIATMYDVPITRHLPDESKLDPKLLKQNPRAAWAVINYARNTLIANDTYVLIACVAKDRKGGTEDAIKKFCKRLGKKEADLIKEGRLLLV